MENKRFILINDTSMILFLLFVFIYVSFGLFLTYNSHLVLDLNYDIIYSIDSGATFWQLYINDRIAAMKHPLIHILLNPIIFLLKEFVSNPKLLSIIIQSILQSFVVVCIYKILLSLTNKKVLSVLFTLIYGFSYTALLLTIFPEVYVFAAFGQVLFLSYFLYCYKNPDNKLTFANKLILVILSVIGYGINLINIVSCGILIIFLICKEHKMQWKCIVTDIIKMSTVIALTIGVLLLCQNFVFNIKDRTSGVGHVRLGYEIGKIMNTLQGTYIEPLYALKSSATTELNEYEKQDGAKVYLPRYLTVDKQSKYKYIPAILLFFVPLFFYIKRYRQSKNKSIINLLLLLIGLYTFFNYSFYSFECALFALNYFPFLIILLGLLYENINYKNLRNYIISLFLIYEVAINIFSLFQIHKFLSNYETLRHSYIFCVLITVVTLLFTYIFICIFRKILAFRNNKIYIRDSYNLGIVIYSTIVVFYIILGCMNRLVG